MGGEDVNANVMPYVVKLEFQDSRSNNQGLNQLCVGTVVHKHFIASTKYCCGSGKTVAISFNDQNTAIINSNTFYVHSNLDFCLIRIEADMSIQMSQVSV